MKVWVVTAFRSYNVCCGGSGDTTVVDSVHATEESARKRETEIDMSSAWDYGDVEEMEVAD